MSFHDDEAMGREEWESDNPVAELIDAHALDEILFELLNGKPTNAQMDLKRVMDAAWTQHKKQLEEANHEHH
jgi:hypothetical protein